MRTPAGQWREIFECMGSGNRVQTQGRDSAKCRYGVQRHVMTRCVQPHPKFVAGTSKVSNNWYGRATTITWVDGKAVAPGSSAARVLWQQLRTAPASIRPIEIGAPWADPANPRYYSGADAMNLIHIGFDGPTRR